MVAARPRGRSSGKQWKVRKPKSARARDGEPRTLEGRARKKLQFGVLYQMGCVLTHAEMMEVLKALPAGWMERECT